VVAPLVVVVVVVFIEEGGLSSIMVVVLPDGNGIPLSHLHNVTSLSPFARCCQFLLLSHRLMVLTYQSNWSGR
jgi:hypothetical protein